MEHRHGNHFENEATSGISNTCTKLSLCERTAQERERETAVEMAKLYQQNLHPLTQPSSDGHSLHTAQDLSSPASKNRTGRQLQVIVAASKSHFKAEKNFNTNFGQVWFKGPVEDFENAPLRCLVFGSIIIVENIRSRAKWEVKYNRRSEIALCLYVTELQQTPDQLVCTAYPYPNVHMHTVQVQGSYRFRRSVDWQELQRKCHDRHMISCGRFFCVPWHNSTYNDSSSTSPMLFLYNVWIESCALSVNLNLAD